MNQVLYVDAFSGISGNMLIGAFLDAGLPLNILEKAFAALTLPEGYQLIFEKRMKGAIQSGYFNITLDDSHDHHHHEHDHGHHHRHLADIRQLIQESSLSDRVKENSLKIFEILAVAEGQVHGVPVEDVHFHEVGATDSILDIVGIAVALEYFSIEEIYCSSLPWSEGTVNTQHGPMPIPAPATLALLQSCQASMRSFPAQVELITPTGAAFLAAFARFEKPDMLIQKQGSGAGSMELPWPNILRVILGEKKSEGAKEIVVLETHIDDMNPEWAGYLMERCFAAGALDVVFEPIFMKKNRPATKISIVANRQQERTLADILLRETTTFGLRVYPVRRYEAQRDVQEIQTTWGPVRVKRKWLDGQIVQSIPEYEDCHRIASEHNLPLPQVLVLIQEQISKQMR